MYPAWVTGVYVLTVIFSPSYQIICTEFSNHPKERVALEQFKCHLGKLANALDTLVATNLPIIRRQFLSVMLAAEIGNRNN